MNYDKVKQSVALRRAWVDAEFKNKPCGRCLQRFPPYVLDFHHRNPTTKRFRISVGVYRYSRKSILAEIVKCDLLCANCHRITEYELKALRRIGS